MLFLLFIYARNLPVVVFSCVYVVGLSQTFLSLYKTIVHKNAYNVLIWKILLGRHVTRLVIKDLSLGIVLQTF